MKIRINKVNTLPGTFDPGAWYLVSTTVNGVDAAELYVADNTGSDVRHVASEALTQQVIALLKGANNGIASLDSGGKIPVSQLPSGIGIEFEIVANIAARNALTPATNILCLVLDASADTTVTSGNALYAYQFSNTTWHKLSEFESLDLTGLMSQFLIKVGAASSAITDGDTLEFEAGSANLTIVKTGNKLTFDVSGGAAHSHSNLTQLNKVGEDADGDITYDGDPVVKYYTNSW